MNHMKVFLLLLLGFVSQFAMAQYHSKAFVMDTNRSVGNQLALTTEKDTIVDLDIVHKITAFSVSGSVTLHNMDDSYVRVVLVDDYNYEFLVYENYPLLSNQPTSEFSDISI